MLAKLLNRQNILSLVIATVILGLYQFTDHAHAMLIGFGGITTLGLFGSGKFETDERPKNWRETILYLFPNGDAPLTAFLSKMNREGTDSVEFNWWEKGLTAKTTTLTGAQTNVATSLVVADSSFIRKDMILFNPRTNELMKNTGDPADATHVTVSRGYAGSTAAAINDGDHLFVIGTTYAEGSGVGNPIYKGPGKVFNYCQIFKTPLEITNTANKEKTRTGGKYEDMKQESLRNHSLDMELAFLFSRRYEGTGANGQPERATGGLDTQFITTNRFDAAGTLTKANWNNYMEQFFSYGSEERLVLAGRTFIRVLHDLIAANTQYRITGQEEVYGTRFTRIQTPYGDLLLKRHPLFSTNAYLRGYAVALDLKNIKERPFRDTDFKENVQLPDADEKKDMFITETGLEVNFESTHAIFENVNAYA